MSIGPNLIFDKSFIESLNADESFWLDSMFMTNIVPIFYVETLADLEKVSKKGKVTRASEDIVKEVADKTPILGSVPNAYHRDLLIGSLLNNEVKIDEHHRPIITGGLYKISTNGDVSVNFKEFTETERLNRWKQHKFLDVEREVAMKWKISISEMNLQPLIDKTIKEIPNDLKFSTIEDIKKFTDNFIKSKYNQFIYFVLDILDIPQKFHKPILKRWKDTRYMTFSEFAPYAAHILNVDLLFYIAVNKTFLSISHKNKPTNFIDLSYLYYLPFCSVFVSSDSFHQRLAPLFIDDKQLFIKGQSLKEDLKNLVEYYLQHKDEIEKYGTIKFAAYPPYDEETLVGRIFDKYFKSWRKNAKIHMKNIATPIQTDKGFIKRIEKDSKTSNSYNGPPVPQEKLKSMTISKIIPVRKGIWRIMPEGIENKRSS